MHPIVRIDEGNIVANRHPNACIARLRNALIRCGNDLNARIINGSFYLDRADRYIKFKIPDSYLGAPVSKEAIRFHLEILKKTVDKYNDKLFAFNAGDLDRVYFTTCL